MGWMDVWGCITRSTINNSMVQTSAFLLTKGAILKSAQLVGICGGLVKLDLAAFEMAQLKEHVEEINKKLDVILSSPLRQAVDFFGKAMRHMENKSIQGTVKEMEEVKCHLGFPLRRRTGS